MEKNNNFLAVVFDMDGVIFDSEKCVLECWRELADKYNLENIEKPFMACTGTTMAKTKEIMLETYGAEFPYDSYAAEASKLFHQRYDGGRLPMKKGVVELLEALKENNKKIALASSTRKVTVHNQLEEAGIIGYFDIIICGDMVQKSKPAPDIFLKACEELGVKPGDAYGIEDSFNGVRALSVGGLHPIMVPDLLKPNEEMDNITEVILDNLLMVKEYLLKEPYENQIKNAAELIKEADAIILGAGAGISTAAGLNYGGTRFTDNFQEFIEKYGAMYMKDMYTAGFYPFPNEEAKWGYWSKHALMNRFIPPALPLYLELYEMVKDKDYFVLTTNVDHQFLKAGFAEDRFFATQGDYGEIQCQKGCHPKVYDAEDLFYKMDKARKDCLIPKELVPKCPVCGGNMTMHLRCDNYFVEDEAWHDAADRYADFLDNIKDKKVVLLELGVGFNTPIIIRFPFEKMVRENENVSLIRLNMNEAVVPESFGRRAIGIGGDMAIAIKDMKGRLK